MTLSAIRLVSLSAFSIGFFLSATLILTGFLVERLGAMPRQSARAVLFNILCLAPASFLQQLGLPALGALVTFAVSAAAGGLIALPSHGWAFLPGVLAYVVAMDFAEFAFHNAQHRIPALWSMHSLHHSDPDLNISTTVRHYWVEHLLKSVTIYLAIGFIFKINPSIATAYGAISLYNYFTHMNVRIGYGRWAFVLNSPQYHRIHHSALTEHHDCNFAALFPVFDCMFGSYRAPKPGEFPATGLDTCEVPDSVFEALLWPGRRFTRVSFRLSAH